jgi:CBS domain-containing protein
MMRRTLGSTAREIMTPLAVTIHEGASLALASAVMATEGTRRLPVVTDPIRGKVVGMLDALDILAWLARRAGHLRVGQPFS